MLFDLKGLVSLPDVKLFVLVGLLLTAGQAVCSPLPERARSIDGLNGAEQILPVDEAFRFGFTFEPEGVQLFWQVMPGYYLYRDKFSFHVNETSMSVELRPGIPRLDEIFGEVEVYEGLLELTVPGVPTDVELLVQYQGCAERGYCYPPQKRSINVEK